MLYYESSAGSMQRRRDLVDGCKGLSLGSPLPMGNFKFQDPALLVPMPGPPVTDLVAYSYACM